METLQAGNVIKVSPRTENMNLYDLKTIDNLRKISFEKCECFLHEDHRWVLPIIHYAQEKGTLSKPCTIIIFDAHHDAKAPTCIDEIRRVRESGILLEDLICLCRDKLSCLDDDWVKTGMKLGLIGDAVIFGVEDRRNSDCLKRFKDHRGNIHRIELAGLPGGELEYQGSLSDLAQRNGLSELWSILEWQHTPKKGFTFAEDATRILLDIDLDCFVVRWKGYRFPWPDEVFEKEFLSPSECDSTKEWTGKRFFNALVSRAALVTIARESKCCGGDKKADQILSKVNHFLFDDKLTI